MNKDSKVHKLDGMKDNTLPKGWKIETGRQMQISDDMITQFWKHWTRAGMSDNILPKGWTIKAVSQRVEDDLSMDGSGRMDQELLRWCRSP